ncbi:MAG TPA: biotin attachment protein [bacterium]|nr:biotin attachment protein [bacterium]
MRRLIVAEVALVVAALAVLSLFAGTVGSAQTAANVVVRSGISGQVLPLQFAVVGQAVKLGDTLVFVRTSTGSAIPAARATANGKIIQVLVKVGDFVNIGDPVAVIEAQ